MGPPFTVGTIPRPPNLYTEGGPFFSVDVECVATGPKHTDRMVAQVALVDQWERVVLNFYVKPKEDQQVFSTLQELTGITTEHLEAGVLLEEGMKMLRAALPKEAVLVGQNILKDVEWLSMEEEKDFKGMLDLSGLFRVYNDKYKNWSYHSLQHKLKHLLGLSQTEPHNAASDAQFSVRLFNLYKQIEKDPGEMARMQQILLTAPPTASFSATHPTSGGVCMGHRKTCKCGAPFFY